MLDLWKLGAFPTRRLIDLNAVNLKGIQVAPDSLKLGALEKMSGVAAHLEVQRHFPLVAQALSLSASPQIRNMASLGGNLLQRPRSVTYRNPDPGLKDGPSRFDAIFGVTSHSAAPYPSDFAVALAALDASLVIQGTKGSRTVRLSDFYCIPRESTNLWTISRSEMITSIETRVPGRNSAYVKIRDRASYQFAVVSAAVVLDLHGSTIREARVAAGGVGTVPWRLPEVESRLKGQKASLDLFSSAVAAVGQGATCHPYNAFKIDLLRRTIVRGLLQAQQIV